MPAKVLAVHRSPQHTMAKYTEPQIQLLAGLGVAGDAHLGKKVKHRSRVKADPAQPNLRQIHLIPGELHQELKSKGFEVAFGQMGENITTVGIDLLALGKGSILHIGSEAQIELTGLRNPCSQLDGIKAGLMAAVLDRDDQGNLIRKSGVMGIVLKGGRVMPGDKIEIQLPEGAYIALARV